MKKYIFCRLVNPKPSRVAVPWSMLSPNWVRLFAPRSEFRGSIVNVVPCAWWRWSEFRLFMYRSMSSDWSSHRHSLSGSFFGILSSGMLLSIGMSIYFILLDFFFVVVNLPICWWTSFCCSIVIRFRKCLANVIFPRSSYSSACWRRWSSLCVAAFFYLL